MSPPKNNCVNYEQGELVLRFVRNFEEDRRMIIVLGKKPNCVLLHPVNSLNYREYIYLDLEFLFQYHDTLMLFPCFFFYFLS